jgi:hypothetical protein
VSRPAAEQAINDAVTEFFETSLRQVPYLATLSGDSFDKTIMNMIGKAIHGLRPAPVLLTNEQWAKQFPNAKRKVSAYEFRFAERIPAPLLVDKPNGKQNWPDLLLAYEHRGLPLECKTVNGQKIVWNSGLPRRGGVYIFNGTNVAVGAHTTFFLGESMISDEERKILLEGRAANDAQAAGFNDRLAQLQSDWTLYPRPMFNCGTHLLSSESRASREQDVLHFLRCFEWK